MMHSPKNAQALDRGARRLRMAALGLIGCVALALRAIHPDALSSLPLRSSCGAATGLPCLFCGFTRATHHLLNGEFAQALYFNWLAFPLGAFAALLAAKLALELIRNQRIKLPLPAFRLTARSALAAAAVVVALWILQVSLAVAFHKHELQNASGPLYALFVK